MIYHNYSNAQIESFADDLNLRYNKKRLTEPLPVDIFDVIDLVNARIAIDYLSPDRSWLGATTFKDGTLWVWPGNPYYDGMKPEKKFYRAGTIIIDTDLDNSKEEQDIFQKNFTAIHECFHHCKHQASFKHDGAHTSMSYKKLSNDTSSAISKIERQANYAAAVFLMPRQAIINSFCDYFSVNPNILPLPYCYPIKNSIRSYGRLFGVNYSPMVYRLQEIGYLERTFDSSI